MKRLIATATDPLFAFQTLNLIGSLQAHGCQEDILLYDLGMAVWQRRMFEGIENLTVKKVPAFVPHWRPCYTWKPWVINDAAKKAARVLYLDGGSELLEPVDKIFSIIEDTGYFLVSQHEAFKKGHILRDIIPKDYLSRYEVQKEVLDKPVIAAGLIGFDTNSPFHKKVIVPWLEHCLAGDNLGWSKSELIRNRGIHWMEHPIIRNCLLFRHDQTILNMVLYKNYPKPVAQPMEQYGSMELAKDGKQILWSPKVRGSYKFVNQVKYTRGQLLRTQRNSLLLTIRRVKKRIYR